MEVHLWGSMEAVYKLGSRSADRVWRFSPVREVVAPQSVMLLLSHSGLCTENAGAQWLDCCNGGRRLNTPLSNRVASTLLQLSLLGRCSPDGLHTSYQASVSLLTTLRYIHMMEVDAPCLEEGMTTRWRIPPLSPWLALDPMRHFERHDQ